MGEYYVDLDQVADGSGTSESPFNAVQLFNIDKYPDDIFYVRGTYTGELVEINGESVPVRLFDWDVDLYGRFDLGVIGAIPIP